MKNCCSQLLTFGVNNLSVLCANAFLFYGEIIDSPTGVSVKALES